MSMKVESKSLSPETVPDRQFDLFKRFVPFIFGSLWWGRDDLIHEVQPEFVEREDRVGHPLVSIKRDEMQDRMDIVPMLVGTSGTHLRNRIKAQCVRVVGLDANDPEHVCFFGSIVEPGLYEFDDLLDGVSRKEHAFRCPEKQDRRAAVVASEPVPWHEFRVMQPNHYKSCVSKNERTALDAFCQKHGF